MKNANSKLIQQASSNKTEKVRNLLLGRDVRTVVMSRLGGVD